MYCIKCGTQLSDGQSICPICETKVYHPDFEIPADKSTYPKKEFKSEEFNRKGFMLVITIIFLIPLFLPVILELSWQHKIGWSGYVFGGVLLFYLSLILPSWFKRPNPTIFVPCSMAAAIAYVLYICLQTGGKWFMPFAFPVSLSLTVIVSALTTLLYYLKKGELYIWGGFLIAFGVWTCLLEMLIRSTFGVTVDFYWSSCTLALFFIVGMLLIIIEIVKPVKETLRKIFYIG